MTFTKIDPADLDSPRRELSNGGLKSVVTLLVCWQIISLLARIGRLIQLYGDEVEMCLFFRKQNVRTSERKSVVDAGVVAAHDRLVTLTP